ncbi:MAG: hypothetical protein GY696_40595, partial [Gammaproteobacteria bacterium]|nr:hypothetical protein [Gammaproteobacteria bacterium]
KKGGRYGIHQDWGIDETEGVEKKDQSENDSFNKVGETEKRGTRRSPLREMLGLKTMISYVM